MAATISAEALIHVSISVSQALLVVSLGLLLWTEKRLRFPRIWIPLACFVLWTALADVLSPDPWGGRAQIRKLIVFLFIPLIYQVFARQFNKVTSLVLAWAATATASGAWGLVQFAIKYYVATTGGQDFYEAYIGRRITGFESHWMTFGALQLSVLVFILAWRFFSHRRLPVWLYASVIILSVAILLGWTRSIWIATVVAVLYLIWFWRPKMMLLVPVVVMLAFLIAPSATRARLTSLFDPHGETDSNQHRIVTFRTGLQMIKAHPWFGLGPEQIGKRFNEYVPADIHRPLPVGYYGHLHNIYVQYAAERGIPALLFVGWMIVQSLVDFSRGLVRLPVDQRAEYRFILHGCVACIIGVLVGGLFEFNLGDSEVLMMFVSVLGLGYASLEANQRPQAIT